MWFVILLKMPLFYSGRQNAVCTVYSCTSKTTFMQHIHKSKTFICALVSDNKRHFKTYFLSWKFHNIVCVSACGGHINGTAGTITSPNFGTLNYPLNTQCVWTITVPTNMSIVLVFAALDTELNYDLIAVSCM